MSAARPSLTRQKSALPKAVIADLQRVSLMKGLAIAAVVFIHILSSWPGFIFRPSEHNQLFVFLDQLCRFCVPVFVGLSGYALTKRYYDRVEVVSFYLHRIVKLLPLYLLWTVGLRLLFIMVPAWYTTPTPLPWWQVILLGRGDYHLYFVPLIFQLYLLFPLLLALIRKWPVAIFTASVAVQVTSIIFFQWWVSSHPTAIFVSDQDQYSLFTSWLSYFVIGMVVAQAALLKGKMRWWSIVAVLVWLVSLYLMVTQAITSIAGGLDPLHALKFTRLIVIPFGVSSVVLAVRLPWEKLPLTQIAMKTWLSIGKWSFIIYLAHTLVLRLIFGHNLPGVGMEQIGLAIGFLAVWISISAYLEKR